MVTSDHKTIGVRLIGDGGSEWMMRMFDLPQN